MGVREFFIAGLAGLASLCLIQRPVLLIAAVGKLRSKNGEI